MDLSTYKIIHYCSMMILFFAFGGLMLGSRMAGGKQFSHRKFYALLHGIGLILLLISGFGQLARLGIHLNQQVPSWLVLKLVIWLFFGAAISLMYRAPGANRFLWFVVIGLGTFAAYLGLFKSI